MVPRLHLWNPFISFRRIIEPHVTDSCSADLDISVVSLDDVALLVSEFLDILCLYGHRSIEGRKDSK